MKIVYVTKERRVNKRRYESEVVGFVSTFGWESEGAKAKAKYPDIGEFQLHQVRRGRERMK